MDGRRRPNFIEKIRTRIERFAVGDTVSALGGSR
jgi:hypothetical protein